MPIKKGSRELLGHLKENGYRIALATSSTRASAEAHLTASGLLKYFDATVCGDEVKNSKPDPEIYLKAAGKLGTEPGLTYAVEDSYLGVEAASNAGMTVFMVPDLNPPREKEKTLAYKICDSLFDIIKEL